MTTDYGCALGGPDHKVNWLITHLQPAMTISLCDEDFPVGVIPMLASELGVDPGRLYDSVKRFVDREQAREAREAGKAAEADYLAARALLDDPSTYEDGNTEYGLEQALELARQLVAEHEAAQ